MKIFNKSTIIFFLIVGTTFEIFGAWESDNLFFSFLMPPDRMGYFNALEIENRLQFISTFLNQDGTYVHLFIYVPFLDNSPLSIYFTAFLINVFLMYLLVPQRANSMSFRLLARAMFFMLAFGMTKELFLILLAIKVFGLGKSGVIWVFGFARPQMGLAVLVSKFYKKFDLTLTLLFSTFIFYLGQRLLLFEIPREFLLMHNQSSLSELVNQFLIHTNPFIHLIGLVLSSLRLIAELVLGLSINRLETILGVLVLIYFFASIKDRNLSISTRGIFKLSIMIFVMAANLPFPHFRYVTWVLFSYLILVYDYKYRFTRC